MKILFLTRLYIPHVGGIEQHIFQLSRRLKKNGHEVTIITTNYNNDLKEKEVFDGTNVYRFRQPNIKFIGLFYTWFWLVSNYTLLKQSDVIHIHDVFAWYFPFKIFSKKKIYITYHGRWGQYPIPKRDIYQKRLGAKMANSVLSIGNYIPKNYGFDSDKINYGAVNVINAEKKDEKLIVYSGRLDKDVGIEIYLKMLDKLKGYNVVFCGDGEMRKECAKYGKVLGWSDPTPYLKKAKYAFACGYLTILEAMSAECLVFAVYDTPLKKDYYLDTPFKDYIVAESNYKDLYKRFIYYEKNKKAYNSKIRSGYKFAKLQTWEKMTKDYTDMWNEKI